MKRTEDYATIETAEEAAVFADSFERDMDDEMEEEKWWTTYSPERVTRTQVLGAITPKEGRMVIGFRLSDDDLPPVLMTYMYYKHMQKGDAETIGWHFFDANALTIKKRGELRELLTWCTP